MVVHLRSISKTPLSISSDIQTHAPRSRSLKTRLRGYASFFNPLLGVWISDETMPVVFDIIFKHINYTWSCSQKPKNDNHLGQVDESWHHHVFIWGETCFSSQIKHLHFNGVLLIILTPLMETMKIQVKTFHCIISYCFIWKDIMASRFHPFLSVWNQWWNTLPRFLHITQKSL